MFFHSKISGPPPYLPSPFSKIAEISEYHNIFTGDKPYESRHYRTQECLALDD